MVSYIEGGPVEITASERSRLTTSNRDDSIAAVTELIFMLFSRFPSLTNQIECPHSSFLCHNNIAAVEVERSVLVKCLFSTTRIGLDDESRYEDNTNDVR